MTEAVEKWLASGKEIAPATLANYRTVAKNHVIPTAVGRKRLSEAAAGVRYGAAFRLMLVLGLRPGECYWLRWSDIDFDAMTLTVRHTLKQDGTLGDAKNDGSCRQLRIPTSAVASLWARKAAQPDERLATGEYWRGRVVTI